MTNDNESNLSELKYKVKEFCDLRDWEQYHNAKDLAVGLVIEAGELLEHFLWKNSNDVEELFSDPIKKEKISEEVADIFCFVLRISERYNIDLSNALIDKLDKNNQKYPVEKVKGLNKKYNEY